MIFSSGYSNAEMMMLTAIVSFSLLIHEYGHGLTALVFGKNPEIHLIAFGGYTTYRNPRMTERERFLITLNGPVFTALLIGLSYYFLKTDLAYNQHAWFLFYYTFKLNIFWLIVNLAPLEPLDGGQLLRSILTRKFGEETGYKATLIVGNICAVLGSIYFLWSGYYFFAMLFLFHGFQNLQIYKRDYAAKKPNPFGQYTEAVSALKDQDIERAKAIFKRLMKVKDPFIKISALEGMAAALDQEGNKKEAYHLLLKAEPTHLKRGKWLLCKLAFDQQNYRLIETYSRDIYDINPSYETALLISKAYAALHKPELSGGWIHTASLFEDAPLESLRDQITQKIYDQIRDDPEFLSRVQNLYQEELNSPK
jgi:Zn-dependent protease